MKVPLHEAFGAGLDAAETWLSEVEEEASKRTPAPDKWCAKQVLGHLIDSALHNHARLVNALAKDDLLFEGYAQEHWVQVQRYDRAPWRELLALWSNLNRHFARTLAAVPDETLDQPRHPHSFDRIAWRLVPADEPSTLRYLIEDYLGHLEHHLAQIRAALPAS